MGMILSRFRKRKTTIEILEDLDAKIRQIERYGHSTEQRHKKIVGTLILYSIILYIVTALIFYFYFFPASLYDQIFYIIPLLIFPILILLTKKMVTWYYRRKISENQEKLSTMQLEKKKILEEVTETETYKKAKEILLKFAPDELRMSTPLSPQPTFKASSSSSSETPQRLSSPRIISPIPSSGDLRRRVITSQNQPLNVQSGTPANTGLVPVGTAPIQNPQNTPFQSGVRAINSPVMGYRIPLPRPILPRERTYLDRVINYLVGDGPTNRYALICRHCGSHNGMALKDEFEYFAFRCCYCNFWNPARKQKPFITKMDDTSVSNTFEEKESAAANMEHLKHEQAEAIPSDSDSDIEVVERPTEGATENAERITEVVENACDEPDAEEYQTKDVNNSEESVEKMDIDELS
ncbi:unnamed protein product [Xylocopa violacea]|uniref:Endoplasmic reticulum junction formation protein lunapark n=2 Tax=Xylocopa violacea TaxID=135666 RepID=A0ABP1P312_XYLVO